ncbi:unnamed protein product [Caenorhabditis nigoni]
MRSNRLLKIGFFVADAIRTFDYEKYVLRMPEPALLNMLRFLRLPDLETLKTACPELSELIDIQLRHLDDEFPHRPYYQFDRGAPPEDVDDDEKMMCDRQNVSMTYFPGDQCVYMFGGETLEQMDGGPRATFNDLWRLETGTMKWSRVVIRGAPYPSPKCQASFVTWGDQLVLYGGRAYRHDGRDVFFSELHFFDIASSTWRRGAESASDHQTPMAGHSAIITDNFMIMYGGWSQTPDTMARLTAMNLRTEEFKIIDMMHSTEFEDLVVPPRPPVVFPKFDWRKTKLVLIREGLILLTGELQPGDYGSSVLIEYDPQDDLISDEYQMWEWKTIPTTGRWWRPREGAELHRDAPQWLLPRGNANCSMPNFEFHQIADVRNSTKIRLVSLGRLKNEHSVPRPCISDKYDATQLHYREFVRHLTRHLETEFQKRTDPNVPTSSATDLKTCAVFKFLNMHCKIENCFVNGNGKPKPAKVRLRITMRKNKKVPKLDDFDRWELRQSILAAVNQLQSKYYDISHMDQLVARVPNRNSVVKRLSIFVAEIDRNIDLEDFQELVWHPQPMQFPSPAETREFALIGANHDIIMHSGIVTFNQSMRRMGQTNLLTPVASTKNHMAPNCCAFS